MYVSSISYKMDFLKELLEINNEFLIKEITNDCDKEDMLQKYNHNKYRLFTLSRHNYIPMYEKKIQKYETRLKTEKKR